MRITTKSKILKDTVLYLYFTGYIVFNNCILTEAGYFKNCFAVKRGFLKPRNPPPLYILYTICTVLSKCACLCEIIHTTMMNYSITVENTVADMV